MVFPEHASAGKVIEENLVRVDVNAESFCGQINRVRQVGDKLRSRPNRRREPLHQVRVRCGTRANCALSRRQHPVEPPENRPDFAVESLIER